MSGIRWFAVAVLFALPGQAENFQEQNTQRWGADYARVAMVEENAAQCAQSCAADTRCQSWTFVRAGVEGKDAACHLKGAVPQGRADPCCISGVSSESSPSKAMAHAMPRARSTRLAASAASDPSSTLASSVDMTPTGMTASIGGGSNMTPAGMTGSIGPAVKQPALPPLAPPITTPATDAPFSVRPTTWSDEPR